MEARQSMAVRQSMANQEPMEPVRASVLNAERFSRGPRRSSIISDTFKLQQVEHRINGHEEGNFMRTLKLRV